MNKVALIAGAWMLACVATIVVQKAGSSEVDTKSAKVKHGQYLVENVSTCGDCHTPFSEKGEPVKEKHLQGATLMFKPTIPVPGWAGIAPPTSPDCPVGRRRSREIFYDGNWPEWQTSRTAHAGLPLQ